MSRAFLRNVGLVHWIWIYSAKDLYLRMNRVRALNMDRVRALGMNIFHKRAVFADE